MPFTFSTQHCVGHETKTTHRRLDCSYFVQCSFALLIDTLAFVRHIWPNPKRSDREYRCRWRPPLLRQRRLARAEWRNNALFSSIPFEDKMMQRGENDMVSVAEWNFNRQRGEEQHKKKQRNRTSEFIAFWIFALLPMVDRSGSVCSQLSTRSSSVAAASRRCNEPW